MRILRLLGLLVALGVGWAATPEQASSAPGPPSASCNGGGCGGWFRSNVTVTWSYDPAGATATSGCGAAVVAEDTGGATFTCTVTYGGPFYGNSVTVAKDSSPPSVNATTARDPDGNGWYTKPVSFGFSGDGGPSGIASCTSGTYGGPDGGAVTISGTCTDGAGNSASGSFGIKYDATPPEVTAAAERPPDAGRLVQPRGQGLVHGQGRRLRGRRVHPAGHVRGARTRARPRSSGSAATRPVTSAPPRRSSCATTGRSPRRRA